jgi:hypothetical protein
MIPKKGLRPMNRIKTSIDAPPPADKSPRLADIVARADRMATELAALAASPSQAAIVASIAHAALNRAFGGVR